MNTRAALLLVQAYAAVHDDRRRHGRILLFTSGQHLDPMPDELPYATTKSALHQVTASLADALVDRGVTVDRINPGPVDTGWADATLHARVKTAFPSGQWTTPEEIAAVVAWLATPSQPITGQIINAETGFRRNIHQRPNL